MSPHPLLVFLLAPPDVPPSVHCSFKCSLEYISLWDWFVYACTASWFRCFLGFLLLLFLLRLSSDTLGCKDLKIKEDINEKIASYLNLKIGEKSFSFDIDVECDFTCIHASINISAVWVFHLWGRDMQVQPDRQVKFGKVPEHHGHV